MIIFTPGQIVTYQNKKWIITGFGTDGAGHTVYYLKRGCYRTTADETEVEA